ncbi:hypothetical protein ACJX0J_021001, partial [Zea mays]
GIIRAHINSFLHPSVDLLSRLAATLPWTAFCTARRTLNSSSRRRGTSPRNSKVEVEHLQTRTTRQRLRASCHLHSLELKTNAQPARRPCIHWR